MEFKDKLKNKVQSSIDSTVKLNSFECSFIDTFELVDVRPGSIIISYTVKQNAVNFRKLLHGGASAAFTDLSFCMTWITTTGLDDDISNMPVTINLNINYMSSIKLNETLLIHAEVEKETNTLLFLKLKMINKENNNIINTAYGVFKKVSKSKSKL